MAALIGVERCAARLPSWIPDGITVFQIEVASVVVHRHVVVAIARDATEFGILVKTVASGCVGDEREKILITQIINPRPWGLWIGDDILTVSIIKMSVSFFHFASY